MPLDTKQLAEVSVLFDECVEMTTEQRDQRLRTLRQQSPDVADELELWLAQDVLTDGALDRLTQRFSDAPAASTSEPNDRRGQKVDHYLLLRMLGRGGMGEVYEARREDADFSQRVAIKLLRRGLDSQDILQRFLRERRILAQLDHPNIARLIDGGIDSTGQSFLVMEYVDGQVLTEAAITHAADLDTRLKWFLDICDAVAYAHRRLIVHRDLKPANVLITPEGEPKLLDFGIAKLLDDVDSDDQTGTGIQVLTPAYAAPEQILGEPISTATDVYALGLILYELMTGQSPLQRQGKNIERVARELSEESIRRPSTALQGVRNDDVVTQIGPARWAKRLSGDLDTIVLHALKREPERRYQGAAELADDIRRHLGGHPVRAQIDTMSYRLRKFVGRHRGGVTAAALATIGILAGMALALWQANVARNEAARAEHEAAAALDSAQRTRRVKDFMMETFLFADPLRRNADAPVTVAEAIDDAVQRAQSELDDDPKLQIDLLDDFGEIRAGQGRFDDARDLFTRALAKAEQVYGKDHLVVAESLVNRGVIENYAGNAALSIPYIERAVAILENNPDAEPALLLSSLGALSAIRSEQGRNADVLEISAKAVAIARTLQSPSPQDLAIALHNQATALITLERFADAEPIIREAVQALEATVGKDSPSLLPLLANLSVVLYRAGKMDEVLKLNQRRVAMSRQAFPGNHPWTADALTALGDQLTEGEQVEEGKRYLREAVDMFAALDSSRIVQPLRYLALVEHDRGNQSESLALLDRALSDCKQRASRHWLCSLIRATRAGVLVDLGRADEALQEADLSIGEFEQADRRDSKEMGEALIARAAALTALGRFDEAEQSQESALKSYEKLFPSEHPETQRVRDGLARIRQKAKS